MRNVFPYLRRISSRACVHISRWPVRLSDRIVLRCRLISETLFDVNSFCFDIFWPCLPQSRTKCPAGLRLPAIPFPKPPYHKMNSSKRRHLALRSLAVPFLRLPSHQRTRQQRGQQTSGQRPWISNDSRPRHRNAISLLGPRSSKSSVCGASAIRKKKKKITPVSPKVWILLYMANLAKVL